MSGHWVKGWKIWVSSRCMWVNLEVHVGQSGGACGSIWRCMWVNLEVHVGQGLEDLGHLLVISRIPGDSTSGISLNRSSIPKRLITAYLDRA
jgi:hypothetical protein